MTEADWLACTEPAEMLNLIGSGPRHWRPLAVVLGFSRGVAEPVPQQASDRKLRLFACACTRAGWDGIEPPGGLPDVVALAERHADGEASAQEWAAAQAFCWTVVGFESRLAAWNVVEAQRAVGEKEWFHKSRQISILLRDVFNPFRPPGPIAASELVVRLAQAAYSEHLLPSGELDPQRLAVLSDALEEAGDVDADLVAHLRGPGPHTRGCWLIDLLLGRQ
jgi:hypothetical protein